MKVLIIVMALLANLNAFAASSIAPAISLPSAIPAIPGTLIKPTLPPVITLPPILKAPTQPDNKGLPIIGGKGGVTIGGGLITKSICELEVKTYLDNRVMESEDPSLNSPEITEMVKTAYANLLFANLVLSLGDQEEYSQQTNALYQKIQNTLELAFDGSSKFEEACTPNLIYNKRAIRKILRMKEKDRLYLEQAIDVVLYYLTK